MTKSAPKSSERQDTLRKDDLIRVRVSAEQKRVLTNAAGKAGLDVSSWLRALGIEKAREMGVK